MRAAVPVIFLFLSWVAHPVCDAAEPPSALRALKAIPKNELKNLASIEGPEGAFAPEEWHVLVHSRESNTGLKEYVVARGEVIATREISQFAETLTPDDVMGAEAVQVDSDKVEKLTDEYAKVNNLDIATLNYHLGREGKGGPPLWRVTCLDDVGQAVATLVVTARKGKVVSHDGFALQPATKNQPPKKARQPEIRPQVAANELRAAPGGQRQVEQKPARVADAKPEPIAEGGTVQRNDVPKDREVRRAVPVQRGVQVPDPVTAAGEVTRPVRQGIRRLLPF